MATPQSYFYELGQALFAQLLPHEHVSRTVVMCAKSGTPVRPRRREPLYCTTDGNPGQVHIGRGPSVLRVAPAELPCRIRAGGGLYWRRALPRTAGARARSRSCRFRSPARRAAPD